MGNQPTSGTLAETVVAPAGSSPTTAAAATTTTIATASLDASSIVAAAQPSCNAALINNLNRCLNPSTRSRRSSPEGGRPPLPIVIVPQSFDLIAVLPPELQLKLVSLLGDRTLDVCAQVCRHWHALLRSEPVWRLRCEASWSHTVARGFGSCGSWGQAYRVLRKATAVANEAGVAAALEYMEPFELVKPIDTGSVAGFLMGTQLVSSTVVGDYVTVDQPLRREVLSQLIGDQDYTNQQLPEALRRLFSKITIGTRNSSRAIAPVIRTFVEQCVALRDAR